MAAKLEWGAKRTCLSCAARFYDMRREPITCPKCDTVFDPAAVFRPRRARSLDNATATKAAPKKKKKPVEVVEAAVVNLEKETPEEKENIEDTAADGDSDGEEGLIEDTSDLAEDDDGLPPAPGRNDEDDT